MTARIKRLSASRKQDLIVCLLGIGLVFVAMAITG
jgi:hypothetical protein